MEIAGERARRPESQLKHEAPVYSPIFPLTGVLANGVFVPFMKVVSSIKSAKKRHPACQVVRRKGRIYVINKVEPRYKARQG